jgi:hypothetical protein
MSNAPVKNDGARAQDSDRNDLLNAIGARWSKFSKRDLSALETNEDLVSQVVAKYGITTNAAQRDVDAMMDGRSLSP